MSQVIIVEDPSNGLIAVIRPVTATVQEAIRDNIQPGSRYKVVDEVDVPSDREFRDAWAWDAVNPVGFDINKARNIKKSRLRLEREEKFKVLDVDAFKNYSNQAKLREIEDKKQILRDYVNSLDNMTTIAELKAAKLPEV